MIPQSFIQDLLARVDIVDVVERYVPLKKAGANYQACCPFHSEKSPSFTVSPTKQFYHCFGCGAHGSAIGFLMEYAGLSYPDAIRDLAGRLGLPVPEDRRSHENDQHVEKRAALTDIMARAARFYREQLKASPKAIDYLKVRGLSGEICARFGIGYAPDNWQGLQQIFPSYDAAELAEAGLVIDNEEGRRYDRFRDRIMFPIVDGKGNVVGFGGRVLGKGEPKYLNSPETPLFEKGRELYGLPQARPTIRDRDTVIVVEGYMDVVSLAQFGVGNAVATLGTATTPYHVHKLLRQAEKVVFCFDGDNAGRKAAWRALEASLEQLPDGRSASFLFLPQEHDPDTYVREYGATAFDQKASQAMPLTEFLLQELRNGVDLSTAEGRARLIVDAKPLISRLQAPLLRLQLAKSLAHAAQMSPAEVESACGLKSLAPPAYTPQANPARGGPRLAPQSKLRRLLKIVLGRPAWSARLPLEYLHDGSQETAALLAIANAVDHGELPANGQVLEFFRDTPIHAFLDEAERERFTESLDEAMLEEEFNDLMEKLREEEISAEISQLTSQAKLGSLDQSSKRRLTELLAQKHRAKT